MSDLSLTLASVLIVGMALLMTIGVYFMQGADPVRAFQLDAVLLLLAIWLLLLRR